MRSEQVAVIIERIKPVVEALGVRFLEVNIAQCIYPVYGPDGLPTTFGAALVNEAEDILYEFIFTQTQSERDVLSLIENGVLTAVSNRLTDLNQVERIQNRIRNTSSNEEVQPIRFSRRPFWNLEGGSYPVGTPEPFHRPEQVGNNRNFRVPMEIRRFRIPGYSDEEVQRAIQFLRTYPDFFSTAPEKKIRRIKIDRSNE